MFRAIVFVKAWAMRIYSSAFKVAGPIRNNKRSTSIDLDQVEKNVVNTDGCDFEKLSFRRGFRERKFDYKSIGIIWGMRGYLDSVHSIRPEMCWSVLLVISGLLSDC